MGKIEIDDLKEDFSISEEDLKHVKGGIGLLLPAVQKVRDPYSIVGHKKNVTIDGTSLGH